MGVMERLAEAKRGAARDRAMSISDPKVEAGTRPVKTGDRTATNAVVDEPSLATPPPLPVPHDGVGTGAASPHRTISDRDLTLIQVSCDFVCACIALPLSLILLSRLSTVRVNELGRLLTNMEIDSLFPVAVVVALALGGIYRVTHRRLQPSAFLELRELSFGVGCGCVLALAVGSFLHGVFGTTEPFTTQFIMAVIAAIGVITVGRIVLRFFLRRLTTTRVLVVGTGTTADRVMQSVRQEPTMTLVGRAVDGDAVDAGAIGKVTDLPELCRQLAVHRILVAASDRFSAESLDIYRQLQNSVHIAMVPRAYELISWRSRLTDLSGTPFLEIAQPHLSAWDKFVKRAFDLCISSAVLLAMSPVLVAVAIAVKLSSPGPVFFRQVRLGRDAEPFMVTKFRSMTMDTEVASAGEAGPEMDDPGLPLHELRKKKDETGRITRFGAFLRRTGTDEIPQFINVFKGDMSVVGPRPFIPSESNVEGWATRRFEVRPGITGLWQVSGRNDLTRNDLVQLDYLYVASWSLWWDLKIVFETPMTMARGIGAY
jgi:exopolysaccharide biosynthesis polyprenyl glycosylphosphotransferase